MKWKKGNLSTTISSMKVSKPIYFLMLVCLMAGLVMMYMTHFVLDTSNLNSDMLDLEMLGEVGSLLEDGELVERMAEIAEFIQAHSENGLISFGLLDLCSLGDMGYLQIVLILLYAAGVVVALLPLLMECAWKAVYLIPANLAPVASMGLLMFICVKMGDILNAAERTSSLIALVVVSVMNLVFASCLMINLATSGNVKTKYN